MLEMVSCKLWALGIGLSEHILMCLVPCPAPSAFVGEKGVIDDYFCV